MPHVMKRIGIIVVGSGVMIGVVIGGWVRFRAEARYQGAMATQQQLEDELGRVRTERDKLFELVTREQKRIEQLSKRLALKEANLAMAVTRLMHEDLVVKELHDRLQVVERHSDRLEDELAMALNAQSAETVAMPSKAVRLEKVIVTSGNALPSSRNGRIVSVHPEWRFVVIDLGWSNVSIGDVVSIYRAEQLLGKARIERVQEEVAAATLLPEWMQSEIQVDDVVRAL